MAWVEQRVIKQWVGQAQADGAAAFPGHGRLPPAEEELRHAGHLFARPEAKYAFIDQPREEFPKE